MAKNDIDLCLSVLCFCAKEDDTMTVKEIADFCGCDANTINRNLQNAKRKIRKSKLRYFSSDFGS